MEVFRAKRCFQRPMLLCLRICRQESTGFAVEIREKADNTIFELIEAAATSIQDAPVEHQELTLDGNCIVLAVWRLLPLKRDALAPCPVAAVDVIRRLQLARNAVEIHWSVAHRRRTAYTFVLSGQSTGGIPCALPKVAALLDKNGEHNVHAQSRKHRTYARVKELIGCDIAPHPLIDTLPGGHWLLHAESDGRLPRTSDVNLARPAARGTVARLRLHVHCGGLYHSDCNDSACSCGLCILLNSVAPPSILQHSHTELRRVYVQSQN